jgi:hypothetical protein
VALGAGGVAASTGDAAVGAAGAIDGVAADLAEAVDDGGWGRLSDGVTMGIENPLAQDLRALRV